MRLAVLKWVKHLKILTLFTGGTISSKINNNVINLENKNDFSIIATFKNKYNDYKNINFENVEVLNILSENISYNELNILIKYISSIDFNLYDGIIIMHGSDTLSYTASFISMIFSYTCKPILFVASDLPLENSKSNGLLNLKNAVDFIKTSNLKGTFVSYSNKNNAIYLGTRLKEADPYGDLFMSFSSTPFGIIENNNFKYINSYDNPSIKKINENRENQFKNITLKNNVLLITVYPNIDFNMFNLDNVKCILLYLYHSATAPISGNLLTFLEKCKSKNIDVYGASFKNIDNMYNTTSKMIENGVNPMFNISKESAYAKLCISYNHDNKEIIKKNIFFENVEKNK